MATVITRGESRHDEEHSAMGGVIVIRMSYISVPVFHIPDGNGSKSKDSGSLRYELRFADSFPSVGILRLKTVEKSKRKILVG